MLTAGYYLAKLRGASDGRQAFRYAALAAVTAVQAEPPACCDPPDPPARVRGAVRRLVLPSVLLLGIDQLTKTIAQVAFDLTAMES